MKKRFLALLFVVTSLYAEPVIPAGAIQAVQQNPALLNTPQAQALMSEHGVTPAEAMQKIEGSQSNQAQESSIQVEQAQNTVDEETTPAEASTQTGGIKDDTNRFLNHKNPFAYRENTTIEKNLKAKQQYLDTNKLSRYAARFYANKNSFDAASMPTPEDYVVTIGDIFSVQIYGDRNQEYTLELRNDGSAIIPYIGPISLGGMSYKEAKAQIQKTLQTHFKQSSFNIRLSKYSTMQVTLVGETKAPGLYNLSSFSTIKELLLASNGINANTSVRDIVIKRGGKIIAHVDFYELLFGGVDASSTILKHGDIVILSNAKKLVSIDGLVNNAAIFELKDGENLDKLIAYASGMKPNASKMNIKVKRFESNSQVSTYNVSITEAPSFALQNGDSVYIYPLDFSAQKSVNLYGNIIRPGSYSLPADMQLSTLLKENVKDSLKSFFLPQTHFEYGVIKRYDDTLNFKTLSFNLASVLNAKEQVTLQPQDEIYFFNQNDIYTNAYIMTKGKVLIKPGKLQYFNGMSVQDAINASGVNGFLHNIVRVTTYYTDDWMPKSRFVESNELNSTLLNPYDEVEVYSYYDVNTLKPISIQGEVINPLKTYYEDKMTLADLVNFAGGLTDKAYNKKIEIVRYSLNTDLVREREIITIELKDKKFDDIILQPYDEVTIFRIPKWSEKMTITLKGQVMFPGNYTIEEGEALSSVLKRAGGFTDKAFIEGAIFTRESVRQGQIEEYNKALARIKRELAIFNAMPANAKQSASMGQASNTLNEVILEAQKYQPIGRVSIELDQEIEKIAQGNFDIRLQDKDTLFIPSYVDTVTVFGEVYNPTSFIYQEGKSAEDYIAMASGYSKAADADNAYVIRADGSSVPLHSGWFNSVEIQKGDTIVVPVYIKEYNTLEIWDSVAKILSSFAVTAAALNSLGITQ